MQNFAVLLTASKVFGEPSDQHTGNFISINMQETALGPHWTQDWDISPVFLVDASQRS